LQQKEKIALYILNINSNIMFKCSNNILNYNVYNKKYQIAHRY